MGHVERIDPRARLDAVRGLEKPEAVVVGEHALRLCEWAGWYAGFCPRSQPCGWERVTAIYLGTTLPQPSSGLPGNSAGSLKRSLSDLAPGEVYLADRSPESLVVSYTTVSPLPGADPGRFTLCCTVSRIAPGGCYPPPCPVEPGRSSASAGFLAEPQMTRPSCRPIRMANPTGGRPYRDSA
ncbi:hypothetical protein GCM10027057_00980 [Marisediminicola antarctica]